MSVEIRTLIQQMVDDETRGWDAKDPSPFLSMIHPDMAWPFAPHADAHDPVDWFFMMGRFDEEQWRKAMRDCSRRTTSSTTTGAP